MAIGLGSTLTSPSSIYIALSLCQYCHTERLCCSMSSATAVSWIRPPLNSRRVFDHSSISFRCRNPFFGAVETHWVPTVQELSLSKVWVAADYSDSVPDSSNYVGNLGYHPLEEVKDSERSKEMKLTEAELAKTIVEGNCSAMLVLPEMVHCEPHGHISWAECPYVIDDYGDIFFEIFDDVNILRDPDENNYVNVLIGMDIPLPGGNKRVTGNHRVNWGSGIGYHISFDYNDHEEIGNTEVSDTLIEWGMPDTLRQIHPNYFTKRLAKAVHTKYGKKMDHPSNGISIVGCLTPALFVEEYYLRNNLLSEDDNDYTSEWKDESENEEEQVAASYDLIDGDILSYISKDGGHISSKFYKLEIKEIELFSVYGDQTEINLKDFQAVEADVLVHSASEIIKHFSENGVKCSVALKALCRKKKGLNVEGANLIGVDRLGMDARVFSGLEAQTIRFSFNAPAMSRSAAEKKIRRMLFPRYHRKNFKAPSDGYRDSDCL